jgi:N-acetylglucosaminyldiphosphoundecaprenol N-acetyl-beta-D-mannosaminyltransferase
VSGFGAVAIAEIRIDAIGVDSAAQTIVDAAVEGRSLAVHLCNAYVLALASNDEPYAAILRQGDLNLADGAPVAWFARRAAPLAGGRPSGAELLGEVVHRGCDAGLRHYLYGSTPQVVQTLADALRRRYPQAVLAGVESPAFGPVTEQQVEGLLRKLADTKADIVWVGLGTPKQDAIVDGLRDRFPGPCVPIGAAFDFVAGSTRRAPRWMRRVGLEWLHRLVTDPRRLWKRYLWGNFRFLWIALRTGRVLGGIGQMRT